VLEEASTFAESGVTVTPSIDTEVKNGGISLKDATGQIISDAEDGNTTTKSDDWDGWVVNGGTLDAQTSTVLYGSHSFSYTITAGYGEATSTRTSGGTTKDLQISLQIGSDTGNGADFTTFTIYDAGTTLGSLEFVDDGGAVNWTGSGTTVLSSWSADTIYDIRFVPDFSADTVTILINGNVKASGISLTNSASSWDQIFVENYTSNSGATRTVYFDAVREGAERSNGDALVEWDTGVPADIDSWDLATYQATEGGETVTVDVEDGAGNVLFSDIGPNFDISTIDTSKNVKLRATLERNDTSNNPTLDYAARRFTR
jgi:hypothetical protein